MTAKNNSGVDTAPFVIERMYDAPVELVWKAITEKERMKQWYIDPKEFRAEVGFEFQFTAGTEEHQYLHLCKILEVVPQKKLSYSWRYDGYEGDSVVTFELYPEGDNTRLRLTHAGLETFPLSNPDLTKKNFVDGWTSLVDESLKNYVEQKRS